LTLKRILYATAGLMFAAGIVVLAVALSSGGSSTTDDDVDLAVGTPLPTIAPQPPTEALPTATASPQGDPRLASLAITRLRVPKLNVNAPIVVMGIKPDGTMESPKGPYDVAWYTFSAKPGQIGNVVMAGHLDYINHGAAVFYRLRELAPGDQIEVVLEDGTVVKYAVESLTVYDEATAPVRDIVGPTPNEAITLITCAGSFDRANLNYNKRLVVRGVRVLESAG
jgi:LPXTG-site transpeptidase (sortase) family protein